MKTNLKLGIFISGVLFLGSLILSIWQYNQLRIHEKWVGHTHTVIKLTNQLHSQLKDSETGQRGYLLTGKEEYLEPFVVSRNKVYDLLTLIHTLTADNPQQQKMLKQVNIYMYQKIAELNETIALKKKGQDILAFEIVASGRGKQLMDKIRASVELLTRNEEELLTIRRNTLFQQKRITLVTIFFSFFISLAIILFFIHRLTYQMKISEELKHALELNQESLTLAFEAGKMGVWEYDASHDRIILWGKLFVDIGIKDQNLSLKEFLSFLEHDEAFDKGLFSSSSEHSIEITLMTGKGTEHERFFELKGKADQSRCRGLIFETTEKIISERTIEKQRHLLIQSSKMASLGEMAGGVAHEINTPLGSISSRAELLVQNHEDGSHSPEETIKELKKILNQSQRIAAIIRGMREFARDGSMDKLERVSVQEVVPKTLELCKSKFNFNGVSLHVSGLSGEIYFMGRSIQVSQVLLNLLNNAFDAVKEVNHKEIGLEVSTSNSSVIFRIRDSGSGIPVEIRDKIMQPFFTSKPVGAGTGLGLSISNSLVANMNGRLYLDTTKNYTEFVVELPKVGIESLQAKVA